MNIWSGEVSDKANEDGKDRFEEAYVSFPLPFKRGDIVRHIETGRAGVVALPRNEQERKEWEKRFTSTVFLTILSCKSIIFDKKWVFTALIVAACSFLFLLFSTSY